MKTSVIEVHDMLSVLSVDEVEKRIGEVPGVESEYDLRSRPDQPLNLVGVVNPAAKIKHHASFL